MDIIEIFMLGIALSMDAFAVAVCKGLAMDSVKLKHAAAAGAWFGGFQAVMPALGFFIGSTFINYIEDVDHWVGFILLLCIGANMIKESLTGCSDSTDASMCVRTMLPLAVATSIDALAAGITLDGFEVKDTADLLAAVAIIGVTTFIFSACGVKIGNLFGAKYKSKAEFTGGLILILLGVKILLEGFGVISF